MCMSPMKEVTDKDDFQAQGRTTGKAYCSPSTTPRTLKHLWVLKQCLGPALPFSGWDWKELHFMWSCPETASTTCLQWRTEGLFNLPQMNPFRHPINNLYFEQSQDHNPHGSCVHMGGCFHYSPGGAKQIIFSHKINFSPRILHFLLVTTARFLFVFPQQETFLVGCSSKEVM